MFKTYESRRYLLKGISIVLWSMIEIIFWSFMVYSLRLLADWYHADPTKNKDYLVQIFLAIFGTAFGIRAVFLVVHAIDLIARSTTAWKALWGRRVTNPLVAWIHRGS